MDEGSGGGWQGTTAGRALSRYPGSRPQAYWGRKIFEHQAHQGVHQGTKNNVQHEGTKIHEEHEEEEILSLCLGILAPAAPQ
jgi:hypothetical protein